MPLPTSAGACNAGFAVGRCDGRPQPAVRRCHRRPEHRRGAPALHGEHQQHDQGRHGEPGVGLDITTPTLKSYLHRSKRRPGKDRATKQARTAARMAPVRPTVSPATAAVAETKADGGATRSGKGAFLVTDKDSY